MITATMSIGTEFRERSCHGVESVLAVNQPSSHAHGAVRPKGLMLSPKLSAKTRTRLHVALSLLASQNANVYAFQRCMDCQQEVDDQEPNPEDQLEEDRIKEHTSNLGGSVSITTDVLPPHRLKTR